MTIERYTTVPPVAEYLVLEEATTFVDLQNWVWAFVNVEQLGTDLYVSGTKVGAGNRIGHDGSVWSETPPGMQIVTEVNPVFVIGEAAP